MKTKALILAVLCSGVFASAASAGTLDDLTAELAELRAQIAVCSNAITFIENKCETDASWRNAYHQGVAARAVCTNEYGIVYSLIVYNDGYTFAENAKKVRAPASPEDAAKKEAAQKALIEARAEELRQQLERAMLPEQVADILKTRRENAKKTLTVTEAKTLSL